MALIPAVTYINEASGDTVQVTPGCFSLPSPNDFVWLGEVGEALVEHKVEKVSHYFTPSARVNVSGVTRVDISAKVTITVSEVV